MTDDLVKRLRDSEHPDPLDDLRNEAADRIESLVDTVEEMTDRIARIQNINMRRDMNQEQRTIEIDRLCKLKPKA
jgi:GTP1/Obg family GTP-binding protein